MEKENFSKRLQIALNNKNWLQSDLEKAVEGYEPKIDKTLINKYLKGIAFARQKRLSILADVLGVNEPWLMGYDVPMNKNITIKNKSIRIPVLGSIPAGIPIELIEDILDYEDISSELLTGDREYFALKVKGNSMEPKYLNGDTIIVLKQNDCESGQDCIVMVNGNDGTFKRVIKNKDGIILQPLNPDYEMKFYTNRNVEELPIRILGVVKEIRRSV